jgi:hypothetical protein
MRLYPIDKKGRHVRSKIRCLLYLLFDDTLTSYNYELLLSLCKIVRSSVILLLPLFKTVKYVDQPDNSSWRLIGFYKFAPR